MIIQPKLRRNIFLNTHPLGLEKWFNETRKEIQKKPAFQAPKTVLIIGGSSGYGLASRMVLANAGSHTLNVSYEKPYENGKTGSAGYWNNRVFQNAFNTGHIDLEADAFSQDSKTKVIDYYQSHGMKIDLVIYSLAAGARLGPDGTLIRSAIKPLGSDFTGPHLDLATSTFSHLTMEAANEHEVHDTVYVMGGSDFSDWMRQLLSAGVLNTGVKALTYTYVGGPFTDPLYRKGTLGKAKDDLEAHARQIDLMLKPLDGEAMAARLKAVVTKASLFIPGIAVYGGLLFAAMMQEGTHESTAGHIHRLFSEGVYGPHREFDAQDRLCLDTHELNAKIQATVNQGLHASFENYLKNPGMQLFMEEFYQINGFHLGYESIDVDLDALSERWRLKTIKNDDTD